MNHSSLTPGCLLSSHTRFLFQCMTIIIVFNINLHQNDLIKCSISYHNLLLYFYTDIKSLALKNFWNSYAKEKIKILSLPCSFVQMPVVKKLFDTAVWFLSITVGPILNGNRVTWTAAFCSRSKMDNSVHPHWRVTIL